MLQYCYFCMKLHELCFKQLNSSLAGFVKKKKKSFKHNSSYIVHTLSSPNLFGITDKKFSWIKRACYVNQLWHITIKKKKKKIKQDFLIRFQIWRNKNTFYGTAKPSPPASFTFISAYVGTAKTLSYNFLWIVLLPVAAACLLLIWRALQSNRIYHYPQK